VEEGGWGGGVRTIKAGILTAAEEASSAIIALVAPAALFTTTTPTAPACQVVFVRGATVFF
jgi:hypothetical protein